MNRAVFDIHVRRVKQTPKITFENHYRKKFDGKKKKKLENVANRVSNETPEVGILLFSILLSLSNPNKKSYVKYLTSRSILFQNIGELHLSQKDNNILYHTRFRYVNYFVAQSHLLEKTKEREKSLVVLQHGLELHPNNPVLCQRLEKLNKKKRVSGEPEKIVKAEKGRIKFFRIPVFLRPDEIVLPLPKNVTQTKKAKKLTDLPVEVFEYSILPLVCDRDLLRISQVSFGLRNFVAQYYERKYEQDGKKFETFVREEFPLLKKIVDNIDYGKFFDLLLSYCFRIFSIIDDKVEDREEKILEDSYSIYRLESSPNESLFDDQSMVGDMKDHENKIYSTLCKEAKMFYKHCNGLVPDSLNYKNSKPFFKLHLQEKKVSTKRWNSFEFHMGPFPGLSGVQNIVGYQKCISHYRTKNHMKNAKNCVFLELRVPNLYYGDTEYSWILDNKKSDVFLEQWEYPEYSETPSSILRGRYGSFIAHLHQINNQLALMVSFVLEKIIDKANIILKKK